MGHATSHTAFRVVVLALLGSMACATVDYYPDRYEIRAEQIQPLAIAGAVAIVNTSERGEPEILWDKVPKVAAPYHRIGDYLVDLTRDELEKHGVKVDAEAPVRLEIRLDFYAARPANMMIRGTTRVTLTGGASLDKQLEVVNNSPGNIYRTLSGTLSRTVITILNDPDVRAHLQTAR